MAQNTEQIEARLCAYVDGELDAVERAEIEKHLAANPAHRLLLNELMQTRDLLQALPHERAPQDVAEVLQGHLERSVLLDGPMELESQSVGRINRWSQYRAVAAILLLTAGLAGVIYKILPSNRPQPQFTFHNTPTTAPDVAEPAPSGEGITPAPTPSTDAIASKVDGRDEVHGKMSGPPMSGKEGPLPSNEASVAMKGGGPDAGQAQSPQLSQQQLSQQQLSQQQQVQVAQNLPNNASQQQLAQVQSADTSNPLHNATVTPIDPAMADQLRKQGVGSNAVCLVVNTSDPVATTDQLASVLNGSNVHFDSLSNGDASNGGASNGGASNGGASNNAASNNGMAISSNASNNAATTGSDQNSSARAASSPTGSRTDVFAIDPSTPQAPAPGSNNSPDTAKRIETSAALPGAWPITGPGGAGANANSGGRVDHMLVARNLTPQEAARLTAALSASQQPGQVKMMPGAGSAAAATVQAIPIDPLARNLTNGGKGWPMLTALPPGSKAADEGATTQPVVDAEPIRAGESLTVTVNGLTGTGPADAHVHVGDDGALLMAQLEPIQAAGLTPAQLQEALANQYHETNVIPNATVTVRRDSPPALPAPRVAATQPATAPANLADAQQQPAASPSSQPAVAANGAATPSDRVDLVIVLTNNATPAPPIADDNFKIGPSFATQPAAAPALVPDASHAPSPTPSPTPAPTHPEPAAPTQPSPRP